MVLSQLDLAALRCLAQGGRVRGRCLSAQCRARTAWKGRPSAIDDALLSTAPATFGGSDHTGCGVRVGDVAAHWRVRGACLDREFHIREERHTPVEPARGGRPQLQTHGSSALGQAASGHSAYLASAQVGRGAVRDKLECVVARLHGGQQPREAVPLRVPIVVLGVNLRPSVRFSSDMRRSPACLDVRCRAIRRGDVGVVIDRLQARRVSQSSRGGQRRRAPGRGRRAGSLSAAWRTRALRMPSTEPSG